MIGLAFANRAWQGLQRILRLDCDIQSGPGGRPITEAKRVPWHPKDLERNSHDREDHKIALVAW